MSRSSAHAGRRLQLRDEIGRQRNSRQRFGELAMKRWTRTPRETFQGIPRALDRKQNLLSALAVRYIPSLPREE